MNSQWINQSMKKGLNSVLVLAALLCGLLSGAAQAEDIDIFAGTTESDPTLPNVIFVLDNSANWARQSQNWPENEEQGQSEVAALKAVLAAQVDQLNVGLIEYSTGASSAERDGGYVRFNLQKLTASAYAEWSTIMDTIYNNINEPVEKRDQSNLYGDLPWDFYNYLAGIGQSKGGVGTPDSVADGEAYSTQWSVFDSPLEDADDVCGDTYLVWIGNNREGGTYVDNVTNSNALKALYAGLGITYDHALAGDGGDPLPVPEFTTVETTEEVCTEDTLVSAGTLNSTPACFREPEDACAAETDGGLCPDGLTCTCTEISAVGCNGQRETYQISWSESTVPGSCADVTTTTIQPTGDFADTGGPYNFDDWSKFLYDHGVPLTFTQNEDGVDVTYNERVKVITYAIDVFNAQQQADLSSVWYSAAINGGGRYFQARSREQLEAALNVTLGDIIAKESAFAAVTLPLSTTNRAQVDNEVYIGMFRPYPEKRPRWYGNTKRYQLALFNGVAKLADVKFREAVNPLTNFASQCAQSFWTSDTGDYWSTLGVQPSVEGDFEQCTQYAGQEWSDAPDGPFVEKGGVAQQERWGGSREVYTAKAGAMSPVLAADFAAHGGGNIFNYLMGTIAGIGETKPAATLRPSVHGDVVHSRPLSLRVDEDNVVLFYGANDGLYRAVHTYTGKVLWSFIAPEHFPKMQRLYDNDPLVLYEGAEQDAALNYERKEYFFDGPTGQLVTYSDPNDPASDGVGDLQTALIFPTMRRGGRMVYAFDVFDPNDPDLLWRQGCETDDNSACTHADFANIGQTWSTPVGGYLEEYDEDSNGEPDPVVMFGGGYDTCLDADQKNYPAACSTANGKGVYLLDAISGDRIEYFATDEPVLTEVTDVDLDFDGDIDFAYVVDAKGNLYRIRFADLVQDLTNLTEVPDGALDARDNTSGDEWVIEKIATIPVGGDGTQLRAFNSPAVGFFRGYVFIAWGTGDRERPLESNYPYADDVQNNFYVLVDKPYDDYLAELNDANYTRQVIDMTGSTILDVSTGFQDGETLADYDGWFLSLPDRGEQVANQAAIGGGKVFFNTFQPGGTSTGLCSEPLGVGTGYTVDLFAPEPTVGEEIAGGGIPIPPVLATVEIPPGCETDDCVPPCEGVDCDPCSMDGVDCETQTVIIGLKGFDPIKIDPLVDPVRQRVFFTEDIDRNDN